jgi:hypothetical protein
MSTPANPLTGSNSGQGFFGKIGSFLRQNSGVIQDIGDRLAAAAGNYAPMEMTNRTRQQNLQRDMLQRNGIEGTYKTIFADANPAVQPEIARRMLTISSTPYGRPLSSDLTDASSLTNAAQSDVNNSARQTQQSVTDSTQRAQNSMQSVTPQISAAQPDVASPNYPSGFVGPRTMPPIPNAPEVSAGVPRASAPAFSPTAATPTPPSVSLFLSPEERSQQEANRARLLNQATVEGQIAGRTPAVNGIEGLSPEEQGALRLGHPVPYGMMTPHAVGKNVSGTQILSSYPDATLPNGQGIDPKGFYDITNTAGRVGFVPSGLAADVAQSNIGRNAAQTNNLNARTAIIPLQAQRLIQQMQLDPQRVEIARANSAARWFGPTANARNSAQFAEDVTKKIDDIEPLVGQLGQSGALGPLAGRWSEFLAGKIGSGDPQFARLKSEMDVLSKAIMRMHGFRNAEQANQFIAEQLNGAKDGAQLIGTLEGLRTAAMSYQQLAEFPPEIQDQLQRAFTGGRNVRPAGTPHAGPLAPPAIAAPNTLPKIPPRTADEYLQSLPH